MASQAFQLKYLEDSLRKNRPIWDVLIKADQLKLPNWYLCSGCISQTIINRQHNYDLMRNIKDIDLLYFDSTDISSETQEKYNKEAALLFKDSPVPIEVVNEARVHLWSKEITKSYKSIEDAVGSFSMTICCVGIRYRNKKFQVYAPCGLEDVMTMTVRRNKNTIFPEEVYQQRVQKWLSRWPKLKLIS